MALSISHIKCSYPDFLNDAFLNGVFLDVTHGRDGQINSQQLPSLLG